ncbi:MAG: hypothetical protein RI967_1622 [Planctomycetota bacterium]
MTPAILGNFVASGFAASGSAGSAPSPSGEPVAPRTATVVWRVARHSMLEVTLAVLDGESSPDADRCAVSVVIRTNAAGVLATTPARVAASLEPDSGTGETAFRVDLGAELGMASLRLVSIAPGRTPIVVTDLPERLGLRGGTYVVDRIEV